MLLLDDGTHFTHKTIAATKTAKASHPMWLDWMNRVPCQVQPPCQVLPDFVVRPVVVRQFTRPQNPKQQFLHQQFLQQQQPVQWRRFLDAISKQLSALPPPVNG